MDKNMISIDDLVRQKLSGSEEEERPGAWMNMRDLLDQKMPVNAPGGVGNWRRILSYTALLLLLASISLGGYEIVSGRRNLLGTGSAVSSTSGITKKSKSTHTAQTHGKTGLTATTASLNTASAGNEDYYFTANYPGNAIATGNTTNAVSRPNTNTTNTDYRNSIATTKEKTNTNAKIVTTTGASGKTLNSNNVNQRNGQKYTTVNQKEKALSTAGMVTTNLADEKNSSANTATDVKTIAVAKKHKNAVSNGLHTNSKLLASSGANINKSVPSSDAVSNTGNTESATSGIANHKAESNRSHHPKATGNSGAGTHVFASGNTQTIAAHKKTVHKKTAAGAAVEDEISSLSKSGSNHVDKISKQTSANKMVLSSVAGNKKNKRNINADISGLVTGKRIAKQANDPKTTTETIEKIEIVQRYVKNPETRGGYYQSDTISRVKFCVNRTVNDETLPEDKLTRLAMRNDRFKEDRNNDIIMPGASFAQIGKNSKSASESATVHKKTSGWDIGKIQEALRNFKYNMGRVPFTTGFIGGINATFFGNSIIDGFQLGLTGNFAFDDHWSLNTELKYVQCINNGATINDKYVTDIMDKFGRSKKTWVRDYYNFSLLQSATLPIVMRYTAGQFHIFLGGNLVYNFSINQDLYKQTGTAGVENMDYSSPKLNTDAFSSRFGYGYIAGLAYQVNPSLQLDFRVSQTMSDNAKTDGAKSISQQLYKNPSFQFSIGYRLSKDKRVP